MIGVPIFKGDIFYYILKYILNIFYIYLTVQKQSF